MTHPSVTELGPATTDWNDFVGTAAADDLELTDTHRSLYQRAELSPSRWLIAAVDVLVGDRGPGVVVYAFDRQDTGVSTHADLLDVAETRGELEVRAIELTGVDDVVDTWLTGLFRRVSLRLVARGLQNVPLVVSRRDSL